MQAGRHPFRLQRPLPWEVRGYVDIIVVERNWLNVLKSRSGVVNIKIVGEQHLQLQAQMQQQQY